jgi:hypothetical protein
MSLKTIYERFLASPNPLSLTENASINYIPTLRTFAQPGPVIRHLENQNKNEVRNKAEKTIAAVEGHDSLSLDLETTLEFISGGGAYLPGLENFVTDRVVVFPSVSPSSNVEERKYSSNLTRCISLTSTATTKFSESASTGIRVHF